MISEVPAAETVRQVNLAVANLLIGQTIGALQSVITVLVDRGPMVRAPLRRAGNSRDINRDSTESAPLQHLMLHCAHQILLFWCMLICGLRRPVQEFWVPRWGCSPARPSLIFRARLTIVPGFGRGKKEANLFFALLKSLILFGLPV